MTHRGSSGVGGWGMAAHGCMATPERFSPGHGDRGVRPLAPVQAQSGCKCKVQAMDALMW